jgi:hypothetical protein
VKVVSGVANPFITLQCKGINRKFCFFFHGKSDFTGFREGDLNASGKPNKRNPMKTHILSALLLLICLTAQSESPTRYFLGRIHLAGLVPNQPPPMGSELKLTTPEQPLRGPDSLSVGFIPAVYRGQIASMLSRNVRLYFQVEHLYQNPRPGKFVSVEVWAETPDPGRLVPLIYPVQYGREPEWAGLYD